MARPPRSLTPGGVYHVTSRGNRRGPVFTTDGEYLLFLDLVRQVALRRRWRVYAYCLMQNHYHLVVATTQADLSAGMRVINGEYAQWFNRLHALVGHVFQGRFHSVVVESDSHLLELLRYLALNPVRAGLCATPAEWRWGSYAAIIGDVPTAPVSVPLVLKLFGSEAPRAREAFRSFVEDVMATTDAHISDTAGTVPAVSGCDGIDVRVYRGEELSREGDGGATCLTRPLLRG